MEFWLTFNNREEVFQLPIPPKEFTIQRGTQINVININDLGELALIGKTKLAAVELSSFFPSKKYSFSQYSSFPTPYECVALIEKWRNTGRPIRLTITNTDVNLPVAIETFNYGERDGSGDVYFSISLKEYRFQNTKTSVNTDTKRTVEKKTPSKYTVKKGDTLFTVAKKLYGDGGKYKDLALKNNIKDPNTIRVGQELIA